MSFDELELEGNPVEENDNFIGEKVELGGHYMTKEDYKELQEAIVKMLIISGIKEVDLY